MAHGKKFRGDKIAFEGRNCSKSILWETSGDTYREIYNWLVKKEVITTWDYDPVDKYMLDCIGKTFEDYKDDDGEIDLDRIGRDGDEYIKNDEVYKEIITQENGNAFYQKWFRWNDEDKDWEEE